MEEQHSNTNSSTSNQQRVSKRVVWDEEKLAQTQKTRGMFQKIDEPKTPYVKHGKNSAGDCSEEEDEGEQSLKKNLTQDQIEVNNNLKRASENLQVNGKRKVDINALNASLQQELAQFRDNEAMEIEEEEEKRRKHEQFKKKRAQHYNEFQKIQQARQNNWEDDSDEEK